MQDFTKVSIDPKTGMITSMRGARNGKPKQKNTNSRAKYNTFNKATTVGVIAVMFFVGAVAKTYAERQIKLNEIDKQVEQWNFKVKDVNLLKEDLKEAYKAFHAASGGYSNPDKAFVYLEERAVEAVKNGEDIDKTISETRRVLWDTAKLQPGEPHQVIKEADTKAAKEVQDAWTKTKK